MFTVEPGIYLLPILLKSVADHPDINWKRVEELLPFGGVRIEDNVVLEEDGVLNLTRQACQAAERALARQFGPFDQKSLNLKL
ncbi:MAG: hypothetical protein F4Z66_01940, partial [Gammaproteobacteria bacterium]|nr:hypothetical protein [Gammaproteobacteria bacterium]